MYIDGDQRIVWYRECPATPLSAAMPNGRHISSLAAEIYTLRVWDSFTGIHLNRQSMRGSIAGEVLLYVELQVHMPRRRFINAPIWSFILGHNNFTVLIIES